MNTIFHGIESTISRLCFFDTDKKESFEEKQKKNDELLISYLSGCDPAPMDYSECKSMINKFRLLLSHRHPKIRELAAIKIIKLIPLLLTLAYLFFGFSKSALKDVAKEMLELMGLIGEMQERGEISLSHQNMSDFNNVINQLVEIIAEGDEEQKRNLLSELRMKNKDKIDKFIPNQGNKNANSSGNYATSGISSLVARL